MRTYEIKLWKNHGVVGALSIIIFIFGLGSAMYLVGLAFLIAGVASFLGASPELLNASSGYVGLVVGLMFVYGGHMCLWGFFSAYKGTVSFTEKEIIYRYPRKSIFLFLHKEIIAPYANIKGVFFGASIMKRVYPDDAGAVPARYMYKYNNSGLQVYFEKDGKMRTLDLPVFKKYPEYYAELRKLIIDNGLRQTEAKCLFVKGGAPTQPTANAAGPGKKDENKFVDILKILLAFAITGVLAYLGYYLGMKGIL